METKKKVGIIAGVSATAAGIIYATTRKPPIVPTKTRLHGKVSDEANQYLLPGVLVKILSTRLSDKTGAGGNYHIDNCPPGLQTVQFTLEGYNPLDVQAILVADINNRLDVSLRSAALFGSIKGKLEELDTLTGDTSVLGDVEVTVDGYTTIADTEGYFEFIEMPLTHYNTLTVPGYRPYPLDLTLIGDADLRVVEMVPLVAEFHIVLSGLKITPSLALVNQTVKISCTAALFIAPVGETVTRDISLTINGGIVATQTVSLTRSDPYWPESTKVEFEFIPESLGIYNVEIDGLTDSFEVVEEYPRTGWFTPIAPVLVIDHTDKLSWLDFGHHLGADVDLLEMIDAGLTIVPDAKHKGEFFFTARVNYTQPIYNWELQGFVFRLNIIKEDIYAEWLECMQNPLWFQEGWGFPPEWSGADIWEVWGPNSGPFAGSDERIISSKAFPRAPYVAYIDDIICFPGTYRVLFSCFHRDGTHEECEHPRNRCIQNPFKKWEIGTLTIPQYYCPSGTYICPFCSGWNPFQTLVSSVRCMETIDDLAKHIFSGGGDYCECWWDCKQQGETPINTIEWVGTTRFLVCPYCPERWVEKTLDNVYKLIEHVETVHGGFARVS